MLRDRYINPFTDFGFKKLFGEEPNKDLLMDFLNEILPEPHKIEELTYANTEHLGSTPRDRKAVFDIFCKGKNGDSFIVEIQKAKQDFFKERSVFYSSFAIQEQAQQGDWDFRMQAIYTIGILDFEFDDRKGDPDALLHRVQLKDQHCQVFYDKLTYIYLELPKFKKSVEELSSKFEKWLYVFRHLSQLQERPQEFEENVFQKLFQVAELRRFSRDEQMEYEQSLKYYRDMQNVIDTARREERHEQQEFTAQMMLQENEPIEKIQRYTGLSKQEIERLREQLD